MAMVSDALGVETKKDAIIVLSSANLFQYFFVW